MDIQNETLRQNDEKLFFTAVVRRRPTYLGHHPHRHVKPHGHCPWVRLDPTPGSFQRRRADHEHCLVHPSRTRIHPDHVEGRIDCP